MRDAAMSLASQNFRVHPLDPGKKFPPQSGWLEKATADPDKARKMWSDVFGDEQYHNIGIATGDGLLVLDFDTKGGKKGLESLQMLDMEGLPESRRVTTPTGSVHVYLSTAKDVVIRNSVETVMPGMDVRGYHGYVVAPGSMIGEDSYKVTSDNPIEPAPDWLLKKIGTTTRAAVKANGAAGKVLSPVDTTDAIDRAWAYLKTPAAQALTGHAGSTKTYAVAAMVKDFGISREKCMDLMLDWNQLTNEADTPEAEMIGPVPAWELDGQQSIESHVNSAYKGGQNAIGSASVWADFGVLEGFDVGVNPNLPKQKAKRPWAAPWIDHQIIPKLSKDLPKDEWVVKDMLMRGNVMGLTADPGVGKTQYLLQLAAAISSGYGSVAGVKVEEPGPVLVWNAEDNKLELEKRTHAIMHKSGLSWDDLNTNRLAMGSGIEHPVMIAARDPNSRELAETADVGDLIAALKAKKAAAVLFDPFVDLHGAMENDNVEVNVVLKVLTKIAFAAHVAVLIVHHSRKPSNASPDGHAGNMHSARGASAFAGAVRTLYTLSTLTKENAKQRDISEAERPNWLQLELAKGNVVAPSKEPTFLHRVAAPIGNGDHRGYLEPVKLEKKTARTNDDAEIVYAKIMEMAGGQKKILWAKVKAAMVADDKGTRAKWKKWLQRLREDNGDQYATKNGRLFFEQSPEGNKPVMAWIELNA